ncbi:hypothetical protein MPLA_1280029 [Mesorhizobium sp. ORS 3359]|nr:hypothetical protein MPLA_1280029 [Mesorhizobium sp. ORS 3359]
MLQDSLVASAGPAVRLCGISYRIAAMAGGALTRTSGQSESLLPLAAGFLLAYGHGRSRRPVNHTCIEANMLGLPFRSRTTIGR